MPVTHTADSDAAAWREIEGEVVLMRLKDGAVFSLEETGAFIWGLLEKAAWSQDGIVNCLCEEFEVDEDTARTDVSEFLAEMVEAGLVKTQGQTGTADAPSELVAVHQP
jgi:hypothetical protein